MAENMIKFLRGNVASLPQTATEGALYFTKDEGVYLGLADGSYHRYGDFIQVDAVADLPVAGAHVNCMYYCVAENILAKWNGSGWTQINKQQTLAELGGVAKSVYDTKMTDLESKDTANATAISNLKDYVGTIPEGYTETNVVAYINKKAAQVLESATGGSSESAASVKAQLDAYKAENNPKVTAAKNAADAAQTAAEAAQATADSKTTMAAVEEKGYATKTEAQGYANAKDTAIAEAKQAGTDAQTAVNALAGKVGTVPENKTVVEMIADAQTAATYDDNAVKASIRAIADDYLKAADKTELQGNIDTVSGKVTTLVGDDANKSVRTIANEELAAQLIPENAKESLDTLQEIAAWIQSHPDDVTAINASIAALEAIVDGIGGDGEKATVKAYVDDAIAALKIGDYAKAADLTALASRVDTIEGQITTINGDDTTAGSIKKALADAKAYTDEKDSAMGTRVNAVEDAKHTHANKAELDLIETGDVTKWNAAQANAEATAASKLSEAKTALESAIAKKADQTALNTTNGNVSANAANITKIMGDATVDGSFAKADADLKTELQGYADTAESDAVAASKSYTDGLLTWGEF